MENITIYRLFTTNIGILNLLYSNLPVAYCWVQTPVEARFSRPIHTGPKAHPPSAQWVPGLFWEVKQQGIVRTAHPPSSAGVECG